jgi:3-(3-hydroxy-phenyl)propionate hydroxylase
MMETIADILILGAGPVGLTLANELARRDVRPVVVDKAPSIREVSKALILHVRTQEALSRVGILGNAQSEAQPLTEVVVNAYGKFVGSWDLDDIDSPFPHPLILGQNRTQHLLLEALEARGTGVAWNTEAIALEAGIDHSLATINAAGSGERHIRARYVVGCEGSNSVVRKTAGFRFEGERYSGEQFIQADCRIHWALPKGRSYLFLTSVGYLMMIEMPRGVVRIFISLPDADSAGSVAAAQQPGAVESMTEQPTLEEVAHHLSRLSGFACDLSDPIWLARYRTSHRYADRFQKGPLFVAGDAGHVHVPIGGQGMNTGIQDAFNLGWKLAGVLKGELHETVLESYNAERHPVAEGLIRGTDFAYRGILHPSEMRQRAARMIGPFLIRNSHVQGFMRETLEELSITYPNSSMNLDLGGAKGPAPGERMLEAPLVRAADQATTSIWAEAPNDAWALLIFAGAALDQVVLRDLAAEVRRRYGARIRPIVITTSATAPAEWETVDGVMLDVLMHAHDRYGVNGSALYLLRPDTVVAARAPLAEWDKVNQHLASIFTQN